MTAAKLFTVDVVPPPHPAAERFPMLGEDELLQLADDIAKNGQIHPVVVFDGHLLDGRNRVAACRLANIEPRVEVLSSCESPTAYIVSANIRRRHLSPVQRAAFAVDPTILDSYRREAKARQRAGQAVGGKTHLLPSETRTEATSGKPHIPKAVEASAAAFGVGRDSAYDMLRIQAKAPEVYEGAKQGMFKTVAEARRQSEQKPALASARSERRVARDEQVRDLHAKHLATHEIAKRLGVNKSTVQHAKLRLGLIAREEENPLRRLTDYAIEFCDAWEIALTHDVSRWAEATPEHITELTEHLRMLVQKTNNLIRRLNKEAKG